MFMPSEEKSEKMLCFYRILPEKFEKCELTRLKHAIDLKMKKFLSNNRKSLANSIRKSCHPIIATITTIEIHLKHL